MPLSLGGLPNSGKEPTCQCRRHKRLRFDPWAWRRAWQPASVFLPGESHGQRSLEGYSPQGCKELNTTEATQHTRTCAGSFRETRGWQVREKGIGRSDSPFPGETGACPHKHVEGLQKLLYLPAILNSPIYSFISEADAQDSKSVLRAGP